MPSLLAKSLAPTLALALACLLSPSARALDLYVSPAGNDQNPATDLESLTATLKVGTTAEIGALRIQKTGILRLPITPDLPLNGVK